MIKVALTCVALAAAGLIPAGAAAQTNPFARLAGESRDAPVRAETEARLFMRVDGGGAFVLQQDGDIALMREEGSQEVLALSAARGVRGETIWYTDTRQTLLRFRHPREPGGTFFPADAPTGVVVEAVGRADALALPPMNEAELTEAARRHVARLAELVQNDVSAEIEPLSALDNALIADALKLTAIAAENAPENRVRRMRTVRVLAGDPPHAEYDEGVLAITVTPGLGYAGRPSSRYIQRAIAGAR